MKFIFATPIYPPEVGGPSIYAQKLKEGLEKKGHLIKVVSYQGLRKYPQPLRISLYFLKLFKAAKDCDAIYAFSLVSCCLPSVFLKKKLFVRIGGDFLWERAVESGRCFKPLREYYQDKKTIKEKFWMLLIKTVFNKTDKIIFTSDFQRNIYLKTFKLEKEKTIIIQNPFPKTEIADNQLQVDRRQLLWVGRLIKLKNIDFLIDVFYKVLLKTNEDLILKIIGEGPARKGLKTDKNVVFSSSLSHQELLKEIQQSYLCLLPSLTEITPNFALECIKLQKPILLTKETGYYEDFKDNLIFIDPQNKDDLEEKIILLLDVGNYLNYIERIKKIPTKRSWDDVIKQTLDVLKGQRG